MIFTAANQKEAEQIAQELVEKKMAACVNLFDIASIYWWEKKIEQDNEALGIIKTRKDLIETIIKEIKVKHSYECPEVIAIPIIAGSKEYLDWIDDSVKKP
ncbi:MAG: divalent-cation tolerance protein CutA [Promethearchaeota archaeon]